ncbi:histidine kinase N-terminal 7TM domain-containing protein [Halovenus rubra]|nr:histidine kinase N-terminal 7TM domain-containing protein [Halovenus rubra]
MGPSHLVVGSGQAIAGVLSLLFLKPVYENRDTPGAVAFGGTIIGVCIWLWCLAVGNFIGNRLVSIIAYKLSLLGAEITAVGWFLLAISVTKPDSVSWKTVKMLLTWLASIQLLIWTNSFHHLVFSGEFGMAGTVLVPEYGVAFWIQVAVSYGFVAFGVGRLTVEAVRSQGLRQNQMALLAVCSLPFIVANIVTLTTGGVTLYDISPFGYILSALLLTIVLFKGYFLDVTTVARGTAVQKMNDAVITVDQKNRVIDANRTALEMFDIDSDYTGRQAVAVFDVVDDEIESRLAGRIDDEIEVSIKVNSEKRYFSVSVSPIGQDAAKGRVFVLRDITDLKRRELELSMLKDVYSRVFRHNVKNELNVIRGHLDLITKHTEKANVQRSTAAAIDSSNRLLNHTQKAQQIKQVLDTNVRFLECPLQRLVSAAVSTCHPERDAVSVRVAVTDVKVQVVEGFEVAIENAIENAVEHNSEPVQVDIQTEVTDEFVELYITDDGDGIPPNEVTPLQENEETALSHGSGVGLWLMRWYVDRSGGCLNITQSEPGTQVKMTLPKVSS